MRVLLHNLRSAHNVGSIFRTSDAVGVEKIYLCGITPTPVKPNGKERNDFVKVSLGAEKFVPWEKVGETPDTEATLDLIKRLKADGYKIYALEQAKNSIPLSSVILNEDEWKKSVLILGYEVGGVPAEILNECDVVVEIPMVGQKKSLNVSVAFGVGVYGMKDF